MVNNDYWVMVLIKEHTVVAYFTFFLIRQPLLDADKNIFTLVQFFKVQNGT